MKLNNFTSSTLVDAKHLNSVSGNNITSLSKDKAHGSSLNLKRKGSASSIKSNNKKIESYLTTLANASSGGVKLTTFAKSHNRVDQNTSTPVHEKPQKLTQHRLNEYYRKTSTPGNIYSSSKNYQNANQRTTNSGKVSKKTFKLKTENTPLTNSNLLKTTNYMNLDNSNSLMMKSGDRDFMVISTLKSPTSNSGKVNTDRNHYSNSFVKKNIPLDFGGLSSGNAFRVQTEPQTTREQYTTFDEKSKNLEFGNGRYGVHQENSKLGNMS